MLADRAKFRSDLIFTEARITPKLVACVKRRRSAHARYVRLIGNRSTSTYRAGLRAYRVDPGMCTLICNARSIPRALSNRCLWRNNPRCKWISSFSWSYLRAQNFDLCCVLRACSPHENVSRFRASRCQRSVPIETLRKRDCYACMHVFTIQRVIIGKGQLVVSVCRAGDNARWAIVRCA